MHDYSKLDYTGHPILDVGMATVTAFVKKQNPSELVEADLEKVADYMADQYLKQPLRGYLTVAFVNSGYTQAAYFHKDSDPSDKQEAKRISREIYVNRVLYGFKNNAELPGTADPFLGLPVAATPFDVKGELPLGRAFRQHIPLQTGEGVINFQPYGVEGLPISSLALFFIQAYPLGSAKCGGRTLFVHSDNPEIMRHFATEFLAVNKKQINFAQAAGSTKMPEAPLKYKTLLISTLVEALDQRLDKIEENQPFSVAVYHMTNSGQGAGLDLYTLPSNMCQYLEEMQGASYRVAWNKLVKSAWIRPKLKKGETSLPANFKPDRNFLYEDLFSLAENPQRGGGRFIRIYFLREARGLVKEEKTDPRSTYNFSKELNLISWKLVQPFLRSVMFMDQERIDEIRKFGDTLAEYIQAQNDKRLFRNIFRARGFSELMYSLQKASTEHAKNGHPPFLTFDNTIAVFAIGEGVARPDWRLARDLVFIRLVEQLHAKKWLGNNQDVLADLERDKEEQ